MAFHGDSAEARDQLRNAIFEADAFFWNNFLIRFVEHILSNTTKQPDTLTMKFLYSITTVLLLQQANAFSGQKQPMGKAPPAQTTSSRKDFLKFTSAAALASIAGTTVAPQPSLAIDVGGKIVYGGEQIMAQKAHGTSEMPVQSDLLYGANNKLADKICNFNRYVPVSRNE